MDNTEGDNKFELVENDKVKITYHFTSASTGNRNKRSFLFNFSFYNLTFDLTKDLFLKVRSSVENYLIGSKRQIGYYLPRDLKSLMIRNAKNIKGICMFNLKNPMDRNELYHEPNIFEREPNDTGRTIFLAGNSGSGKTTLLVNQLNLIAGKPRGSSGTGEPNSQGEQILAKRPMYDRIFIMTTSPHALPFKDIKDPKIIILPDYCPSLVIRLKQIQDVTKGKLAFLLILDDCFSKMKKDTIKSLMLTLRNSNISTAVLSQYIKHLTPDCRNSVHRLIVTKLLMSEWKYLVENNLGEPICKTLQVDPMANPRFVADKWKRYIELDSEGRMYDFVDYLQRTGEFKLIKGKR